MDVNLLFQAIRVKFLEVEWDPLVQLNTNQFSSYFESEIIFDFEASELKISYLREKRAESYQVYVFLKNLKVKDKLRRSLLVESEHIKQP
jgi:hypothetical protein